MAGKQGLSQRLKNEIRRRQKQPRPQAIPTGNVPGMRWNEITDQHQDVLQNIEMACMMAWQKKPAIDDATLLRGLVAAMLRTRPEDPLAATVYDEIDAMHALRRQVHEIEDALWLDSLRVVAESVRTHSSLRPGASEYLDFIRPFLNPPLGKGGESVQVFEGVIRGDDQ